MPDSKSDFQPHHHFHHTPIAGAYVNNSHITHPLAGPPPSRSPRVRGPRPSGVYIYTIRPSTYTTSSPRDHAGTMMRRSTSSSTGLAALLALGALTTYVYIRIQVWGCSRAMAHNAHRAMWGGGCGRTHEPTQRPHQL